MADFTKGINEFRKGTRLRKINEDPTYLSFFFMFDDQDKEHSPLLSGPARDYLTKVLRADEGNKYAQNLDNFKKVLFKINKDLPWFWQSISGIDAALKYEKLQEPWWGGKDNALEIECLEENVELTAFGLMDLYKRACYDFVRWVEVIPHNLRHFSMYVYITEVRKIQQDTNAPNLGLRDNPESGENSSRSFPPEGKVKSINSNMALTAAPYVKLKFEHCEFDIDAISSMFAELNKNPGSVKPKIGIKWGRVEQVEQKIGENLIVEEDATTISDAIPTPDKYNTTPFDPKDFVQGKLDDAVQGVKDAALNKFGNLKDAIAGGNNSEIGNAYGDSTGSLTSSILGQAEESILAKLFMGNVHGVNAGNLQTAIRAGSVNALANVVTDLFGGFGSNPTANSENLGKIYPDFVVENDELGQERIHPQGVDSSPDGNISPTRVYDDSPPPSNAPINDNVHE